MKNFLPLLLIAAGPAWASDLPPGMTGARLVAGWSEPDGGYLAALEITLAPGWKTYWRSPGDAGVPPLFDWSDSENMTDVTPIWPAPEVFDSGGLRTIGYHDELVLPLHITRPDPNSDPLARLDLDLGICRDICVPAHMELTADFATIAKEPDLVRAALARVPDKGPQPESCDMAPIADGMRVTATLRQAPPPGTIAVLESTLPDIWVSEAELSGAQVSADFVPPQGRPFDLAPDTVRMTLLMGDAAQEITGCPEQ